MGYRTTRPKADWLSRIAESTETAAAHFNAERTESLIAYRNGVTLARFAFARDEAKAREFLEAAPFTVASFETLYPGWKYRPPSFGRNHVPHGWGCAFKGTGHDHLVSRRWLEYGPWTLIKGAADLSLVLFHALDANAKEALAQAKPGHKAMGIDDDGGFLQEPYVFETTLSGQYEPERQVLRIVVLGRDLRPVELLDACAARRQGALTPNQPLRQVAYVFPKPAEAQRHLHALWLRELECWTIVDGVEQRLDTNYRPK